MTERSEGRLDPEDVGTNTSGNRPFRDVLASHLSRRGVLMGSLAGAAATGFLAPRALAHGFDDDKGRGKGGDKGHGSGAKRPGLVNFKPLTEAQALVDITKPSISSDYEYQVFIPWGTPIEPGATKPYNGESGRRPTPEEAQLQVGLGHDGMAFFPDDERVGRFKHYAGERDYYGDGASCTSGMLVINHEYGHNQRVLGKALPTSLQDVRLSQAIHGVSVLAIERRGSRWEVVKSDSSRRITANSPVRFSGPAAASPLLQNPNGNVPLGTVNNCGSGPTPWGTYLTCEENFNGYFAASGAFAQSERQRRYGISATGGNAYSWHLFDKRFDLSDPDYVNESHRFGWAVEIDPFDGTQIPVKRTALGRFKHEAAAIAESESGRAVVYMGDDEANDHCYKFVSARPWRSAVQAGLSPLDEGVLYAAKFNDDGTGEWLELSPRNPKLASWTIEEILIFTRLAADAAGATPMDRPEWTTIGKNGSTFWTMTSNPGRTVPTKPNPEAPNNDGHIIKTTDDGDRAATTFRWEIFILASSTRGTDQVFADPDSAYADPYGRLFIGTDGGGQPDGLNDQLVVFDTTAETPEPRRLLCGVKGDEITGYAFTPDYRTAFTNIQHPGGDPGDPAVTNFPAPRDGVTIPRDCTLIITKKDGGVIGS